MMRSVMTAVFMLASMATAHAETAPDLQPGEKLEKLQFPAVTMELKGWTKFGNGKVYTLPVKAGQHVKIAFESKSKFAFLAIFDLASPDEDAIFGTDEDGKTYDVTVKTDTTWLLRPYYSKVSPRRGLGAPFSIMIEPQAAGSAPPVSPAPAGDQRPSLFPPAPGKSP